MIVIPAVDIKNGKCVRLFQGKSDQETVYSDDPVSFARKWEEEGAERLHLVDLDGAFEGGLRNFDLIAKMIQAVSIPVEVGGGIRDFDSIERYINAGAAYVILGTVAQSNPEFVVEACKKYPGKIIVGIDAKNGLVAVKGWEDVTKEDAVEMAKRLEGQGVAAIIYTDIARDGTLTGPNLESVGHLARSISIPVIASGGVSKLSDIEDVAKLEPDGVTGVIVGKAIYTGNVTLPDALRITQTGNRE